MIDKYWLVHNEGRGYPSKKHDSMADAVEEATRLCKKEGSYIIILEAVGMVVPKEMPTEFIPITKDCSKNEHK